MWVSEPYTGHEEVMPAWRSESVLTLWKEAGVPGEKNHGDLLGTDKPKQAAWSWRGTLHHQLD